MTRNLNHPREIRGVFNQEVDTPLGRGRSFGHFSIRDAGNAQVVTGIVVRLSLDETVRKNLAQSNCLTPRANKTALFVFTESELS